MRIILVIGLVTLGCTHLGNTEIVVGAQTPQNLCDLVEDCEFNFDGEAFVSFEGRIVSRAACGTDQLPYGIPIDSPAALIASQLKELGASAWRVSDISVRREGSSISIFNDEVLLSLFEGEDGKACYKESLTYL